jgi:hypothetical protein
MLKRYKEFLNENNNKKDFIYKSLEEVKKEILNLLAKFNIKYKVYNDEDKIKIQFEPLNTIFSVTLTIKDSNISFFNNTPHVSGIFPKIINNTLFSHYSVLHSIQDLIDELADIFNISTSDIMKKIQENNSYNDFEDMTQEESLKVITDFLDRIGLSYVKEDLQPITIRFDNIYIPIITISRLHCTTNYDDTNYYCSSVSLGMRTIKNLSHLISSITEFLKIDTLTPMKRLNINENKQINYFGDKSNIGYDSAFDLPLYYLVNKNVKAYTKWMSPDDFLKELSFDYRETINMLENNIEHVNSLKKKMEEGIKIDRPYLMYVGRMIPEHEGRHRAYAAKKLGQELIPVTIYELVSNKYVNNFIEENGNKTFEELDEMFKDKGYKGISDLGFRTITNIYKSRFPEKINESLYQKLSNKNLPFPKVFPNDLQKLAKLIENILKLFKIDFDYTYYDENKIQLVLNIQRKSENEIILDLEKIDAVIGTDIVLFLTDQDNEYDMDEIIDPLDFYCYILEDLNFSFKIMKKLNEKLTRDFIIKNPNTTFDEKEDQLNKLDLIDLNDYKKNKAKLERIFNDLDKEINNPIIFKITQENPFMKQYTILLSKKRRKELLDKQIEQKEENIEGFKKELSGSDNEQRTELLSQIREVEQEIKNMEEEKKEFDELDLLFKKWDNQIFRVTRDLKNGKSVLDSTLNWIK